MTELAESCGRQLSGATQTALRAAIEGIGMGVVVVCGFPASGKTTAARFLAEQLDTIIFDKDGFAPKLEESVMAELTGNPHDRDSAMYRRVVGPYIYDALIANALMVGQRNVVVVDAPFLEFVGSALQSNVTLSEYLRSKVGFPVDVRTVWMSVDPKEIRERMIKRGAERDLPKLADWSAYRSEILDSGLRVEAEKVVDSFIVNE
ncbi:AAA family ATPase [Nocardia tengchongensis]|uniref:AAA family ATPase n=1 Tax=Nocardia tengchongensis TaxID=2055889 RepID=UPI0036552BB5